ncbi:MAG: hypothetical protein FWF56_05305 [Firmicutes bacterium]|nr:hypothetical protein [Bacillota bacterium]MCL1954122.1 hypothetical protein [Bacillota bacterium]
MVRLNDFLKPLDNFQYSVNLEYDLNDDDKIRSFIPTIEAISIIEEILLSTASKSQDRTRILSGAYGKGKSHLALTLLGLLSGKDKRLFKRVLEKSKQISDDTYNNILQYFDKKIKFLPVILNTNQFDLKSTILQGLNKSLKREDIDGIIINTFFDTAISVIQKWKIEYPETYKIFEREVGNVDNFLSRLRLYDNNEYDYFVKIYPKLTAGNQFNPMQSGDVVDIIEHVANQINKKGYQGLYFVYDEFSKFLDNNIDTSSQQNIKLLQDIAEKFNRSSNIQLHLLLITHKNIESYVGNLPKKIVDDWKGISKRFKPISIDSNDSEIFDMIAVVLNKNKTKYNEFLKENKKNFDNISKLFEQYDNSGKLYKSNAFSDIIKHTGLNFVKDCYPLHPYSLLILPKLSELMGQNERTIFTFLASNERYTVKYFIRTNKDEFPIIEPDIIYDYFEQQFKGEPFGSDIRKHWQNAISAIAVLSQFDNQLSIKIIKTISLLYILGKFDILPPDLDLIRDIYSSVSNSDYFLAINLIRHQKLLIELEYRPFVRIRELAGNNADDLIQAEYDKIEYNFDIKKVLETSLKTKYLYPYAYNDKYEITRFFSISFVDTSTLSSISNINLFVGELDKRADGHVLAIVLGQDSLIEDVVKHITRLGGNRVLYVVPKMKLDITNAATKYIAIKTVLEKSDKDITFRLTTSTRDELNILAQDLQDKIVDCINSCYFNPEQHNADYYYQCKVHDIKRKTDISRLLSKICENEYAKTPRIINENINRFDLSTPMKSTRSKIVDKVLSQSKEPKFGFNSSQDISVLRHVYVNNNIILDIDNPITTIQNLDDNYTNMFCIIEQFVQSARQTDRNLSELYDNLTNPEHGIALRSGVVPFFLAVVFAKYSKQITLLHKRKEMPLSANLLEQSCDNPNDFIIRLETFDSVTDNYIYGIQQLVSRYVKDSDKGLSGHLYLTNALQAWFFNQTRFDRSTIKYCDGTSFVLLDDFTLKFKRALSVPEINPHEFLFKKLAMFAGVNNICDDIVKKVEETINKVQSNSINIVTKILKYIKQLFCNNNDTEYCDRSLSSIFEDYYDRLNDRTKQQVFVGQEAALMDIIRNNHPNENSTVKLLIRNLVGIRLEDLNDDIVANIEGLISQAKLNIDNFDRDVMQNISNHSGYDIKFFSKNGVEETRHISITQLPDSARTFANEIEDVFDSYGTALAPPQKARICLDVIRKYIK